MLSHLDNTLVSPFAEEEPFSYGDHTVVQLRSQPFVVQDELGTVVTIPLDTTPRPPPTSVPSLDTVFVEEDPIARMERKLDAALRQLTALQQRLESLDVTLARALTR